MKVAICSHFGGFQPSYALHVGWHERARILERYNVDFDFLVNQKCKENLYPNQKNCLPNPSSDKPFNERAELFRKTYEDVLAPYDVVLTADMVYQRKGNFLAYNAAMRESTKTLKAWWCHWIHSSWTDPDPTAEYPYDLRYKVPPRSFLVYLNSYELEGLAKMYDAKPWQCYPVYNPKDIRSFHEMDDLTWKISDILDFQNKQVIDIFPVCTTRLDAKGIDSVIFTMAAIKQLGFNVALVIANSNSAKRPEEVTRKKILMSRVGLIENEDYIWTSDINREKPVPRKSIADLFKLSNLFIFGSWRETVGNIFQEAKISGCQLVLNRNLPCLREMGGKDAIYFEYSFKTPGIRDGLPGDLQLVKYAPSPEKYFENIALKIVPKLENKAYQWYFSLDRIWLDQFEPLLRRAYLASQDKEFLGVQPLEEWDGEINVPKPWFAYEAKMQWGQDMAGAPRRPLTDQEMAPINPDETLPLNPRL